MSEGTRAKTKDGETRGKRAVLRSPDSLPTRNGAATTGLHEPNVTTQLELVTASRHATVTGSDPRLVRTGITDASF